MLAEGRKLAKLAKNVTVKVPLTPDGLKTCKALAAEGTMVNVTLCFSAAQAMLAAKAGATFISPFVGRLDDIGEDGMALIADIVQIYRNYPDFKTEVLVASIRQPMHVIEAAKLGAHVGTLPPAVLRQLFHHPLTDKGLAAFLADWAKTGQSILGPKPRTARRCKSLANKRACSSLGEVDAGRELAPDVLVQRRQQGPQTKRPLVCGECSFDVHGFKTVPALLLGPFGQPGYLRSEVQPAPDLLASGPLGC